MGQQEQWGRQFGGIRLLDDVMPRQVQLMILQQAYM